MTDQKNNQNNAEVPVFSFKLTQLTPAGIPELFPQKRNQSKRKPGMITNFGDIRKTTVGHLLEVFRPAEQNQHQQFKIKKKLVTNAIDALYQLKKNPQFINYSSRKQSNTREQRLISKQLERSKNYIYKTPSKIKLGSQHDQSTSIGKRSQSQNKLNFSRYEEKFTKQQKQKLRKKSGFYLLN